MITTRYRVTAAVVLALAAGASPLSAQESSGSAGVDRTAAGLEEVVVTATRRVERAQDIPISIAAVSGDQLQNLGITGTESLQMVTTGLVFGSQVLYGQPYIRAVGSDLTTIGTESSIALYIDGVYQARQFSLVQDLNNVERVEILKGPQGALYGRNATGGAINIVTKRPQAGFAGDLEISAGDYNLQGGRAYLTGGSETLAFSLAGYSRKHDGYYKNLVTGHDVENQDDIGGMAKLLWSLDARNELTLALDASNTGGSRGAFASQFGTDNVLAVAFPGSCYTAKPQKTCADEEQRVEANNWQRTRGASAHWQTKFDNFDLLVIGGYRNSDSRSAIDVDASSAPIIYFANQPPRGDDRPGETFHMSSVESQLVSTGDGPFSWLLGGLYYKDSGHVFVTIDALNNVAIQTEGRPEAEAYAGYAEGTYKFGADGRWKVTGGLRYANETKERKDSSQFFFIGGSANGVATPVTEFPDAQKSWNDTLGSLSLSYDIGPGNVYARFAQGFKSGSFNVNDPTQPAVDPETIDSFELGMKTELVDGRLQFNLAGFYYDYKDLQVQSIDSATGGSRVQNAAAAEIKGLEAELRASVTQHLQFQLGMTYLDAKYTDFPHASVTVPCSTFGIPAPLNCTPGDPTGPAVDVPPPDLSDNDMRYAPEFSANVGVTYDLPVSFGSFQLAALANYMGDYFFDPSNRLQQDAYTVVNASATFRSVNDSWWLRAWGNNLSNAEYASYISPVQFGDFGHWADPRTYGVTAGYNFK